MGRRGEAAAPRGAGDAAAGDGQGGAGESPGAGGGGLSGNRSEAQQMAIARAQANARAQAMQHARAQGMVGGEPGGPGGGPGGPGGPGGSSLGIKDERGGGAGGMAGGGMPCRRTCAARLRPGCSAGDPCLPAGLPGDDASAQDGARASCAVPTGCFTSPRAPRGSARPRGMGPGGPHRPPPLLHLVNGAPGRSGGGSNSARAKARGGRRGATPVLLNKRSTRTRTARCARITARGSGARSQGGRSPHRQQGQAPVRGLPEPRRRGLGRSRRGRVGSATCPR